MPPDTTSSQELPKDECTTPSNGSSTAQTTSAPPGTSTLIQRSDGLYQIVNDANGTGSTFIPVFVTGTNELNIRLLQPVLYEIVSDIESFISTDLIPYLHKLSPGDLKALSRRYVLEVRYGSRESYPGPSCSFKYTIRLFSKFRTIGMKSLISISLGELSKILSLTRTP
jgi:hypothetical protein